MKIVAVITLVLFAGNLVAQVLDGKKVNVKAHPESVHFDGRYFYVSNLGVGANGDKDGDGYISVLSKDGVLLKANILPANIKLHTPTGMATKDGMLYVVDMDRIVAIPVFSRAQAFEIDLSGSGATFLNDLAFVTDSHVVVTESMQKTLYAVDVKTKQYQRLNYPAKLGAPNGISFEKDRKILFIAANLQHGFGAPEGNGQILGFNVTSRNGQMVIKPYAQISWGRFIDGIEYVPGTDKLLVSDWSSATDPGKLAVIDYRIERLISETKVSANGFADFAFVPADKLIVAPDLITGDVFFYSYSKRRR